MTGDARADLLVSGWEQTSGADPIRYVALDGVTGRTMWRLTKGTVTQDSPLTPIGDANGDHRGDFTSHRYFCGTQNSGVTITAWSGRDGSRLWGRDFTVPRNACTGDGPSTGALVGDTAGDVNNDGALDLPVVVADPPSSGTGYILSGHDGSAQAWPFLTVSSNTQLLRGSLDGNGADLVDWAWAGQFVTRFSAYDGRTAQPLWSTPIKGDFAFYGTDSADVTNDGHDDVLLVLTGVEPNATEFMLDGVTGAVRWRFGG
jgi:hypothetical protein